MSSTTMKNRPIVFEPKQWAVPAPVIPAPAKRSAVRSAHRELWAGVAFLAVWSLLWLAVIVSVLAPLDAFVGGA